VPVSTADLVVVPEGYTAQALAPWGDPVGLSGEDHAFKEDGSNTAAQQETQIGMHHDGMHYFRPARLQSGLLVINHEYVDEGLLFPDGMTTVDTREGAQESRPPTACSVIEVEATRRQVGGGDSPRRWARRITRQHALRNRRARSGPCPAADRCRPEAVAGAGNASTTAPAASRHGAPT